MRKSIIYSIIGLFTIVSIFTLFSCNKEDDKGVSLDLNKALNIKSFTVDQANAEIDTANGTIDVYLPFGSNFTDVTPTIQLPEGATITPASGEKIDLTNPVQYQVINGNRYKNYTVTAHEVPAIQKFEIAGVKASINEDNRSIKATVPSGSDMSQLEVSIQLIDGASISPASGSQVNFTNPVTFTVTTDIANVDYTVTAVNENAKKAVAFLGTAKTKDGLSNPDEKAAADWFFDTFQKADYISFDDIKDGTVDLSKYAVIWWHDDEWNDDSNPVTNLPNIAQNSDVIDAVKAFHANGGALLLTTYATGWLDPLGIIPAGKGPNNLFGDHVPNQSQDLNGNWGISFEGHEDHPLFQGLTLASDISYPVAYLLSKKAFRLNHTSWWQVDDWGGYGDAAGWRDQTGGIDLAGPQDAETRNQHVSIAEFPKTDGSGNTVVVTPGAYDWYAEPNPDNDQTSPENQYLANIKKLTKNAINYLKGE